VSARLRADNLTDVEYEGIYGFRAPGRSIRAGLTIGRP
jgi:outer membrane cobalamin receptor